MMSFTCFKFGRKNNKAFYALNDLSGKNHFYDSYDSLFDFMDNWDDLDCTNDDSLFDFTNNWDD